MNLMVRVLEHRMTTAWLAKGRRHFGAMAFLLVILAEWGLAEDEVRFNRDIRPILSDRCFVCHGPDRANRKADLRLDQRASAIDSAIVPSHADRSSLIERITSDDPEVMMPPAASKKGKLTSKEIDLLRRWIDQGAEYESHWSLVPPARSPLPVVRSTVDSRSPIDIYLLAKMEQSGLALSPPADDVTLLRRLTFDVVGLPPTPHDVDEYIRETRPDKFERKVDELLASPSFGERFASYWLDLVRFADTVGYHGDQEHHISPYRDYVIHSLNSNLPFDRFTTEQIAGDLLPKPTTEQRIATAYNRVLQTSHEGGVQAKEYLAKYSADRVRNLSTVWLGLTMGCAECHDHKFDPYTQKDFYSLAAFFADVTEKGDFKGAGDTTPTKRPPEIDVLDQVDREEIALVKGRMATSEADIKRLTKEKSRSLAELARKFGQVYRAKKEISKGYRRLSELQSRKRRVMVTVADKNPRPIRILSRGDWMDENGPIVEPAVPEAIRTIGSPGTRSTRLDLAHWLTRPDHPQTSRVFVNRLWYLAFGVGLSKSLEDVGSQGEWPTHPELLDWLACEFVESGWDIKEIERTILESAAYRQSSLESPDQARIDPENRLVARQASRRLSAEMIRDAALMDAGLLVTEIGGRSVRPYQPKGYYRYLNFPTREYKEDVGENLFRRSVYTHWQRQYLHPMLKAFDAPSREECTANRQASNTPSAALVLLNDPEFIEAANQFAARILREELATDSERLKHAWRIVLSRPPNEEERALMLTLLGKHREYFKQYPDAAKSLIEVGRAERDFKLDPIEWAAWGSVARTLLNLDETITRY